MVFKKLIDSIERGVGIGIGFFLVAGLLLGVYAFVEPSSGPSADFYYNSESPLVSNNTMQFVGYTGTMDGDFGGIRGANIECDTVYEGSRWMTYNDFLRVSHQYNYSYEVWINEADRDGASRDGNVNDYPGNFRNNAHLCNSWTSSNSGTRGTTLNATGFSDYDLCDQLLRLACVRGN